MMLKLKPGVRLGGLKPEALYAITATERCLSEHSVRDTVITSISDGRHMPGSLHYIGHAFDFRRRDLTPELVDAIVKDLAEALGEDFDVVLKPTHVHVEYQPKRPQ